MLFLGWLPGLLFPFTPLPNCFCITKSILSIRHSLFSIINSWYNDHLVCWFLFGTILSLHHQQNSMEWFNHKASAGQNWWLNILIWCLKISRYNYIALLRLGAIVVHPRAWWLHTWSLLYLYCLLCYCWNWWIPGTIKAKTILLDFVLSRFYMLSGTGAYVAAIIHHKVSTHEWMFTIKYWYWFYPTERGFIASLIPVKITIISRITLWLILHRPIEH